MKVAMVIRRKMMAFLMSIPEPSSIIFCRLQLQILNMSRNENSDNENHKQNKLPKQLLQASKVSDQNQGREQNSDRDSQGDDSKQISKVNDSLLEDKRRQKNTLQNEVGQGNIQRNRSRNSRLSFLNKKSKDLNVNTYSKEKDGEGSRRNSKSQNTLQGNGYNQKNEESFIQSEAPFVQKLTQQNAKLQSRNKKLWEQLKDLSNKVDSQLHKRNSNSSAPKNRKIRMLSSQSINQMQLQNAYKQCQIYKKEIHSLKRRDLFFNEDKVNSLRNQLNEEKAKNNELIQELKTMKQSNAHLKKIMSDMRDDDYIKLKDENMALKKENLKFKQKIEKEEREERIQGLQKANQKKKIKNQEVELQKSRRKTEEKEEKNENVLKNKVESNNKKIRLLTFDNNRQKQMIEELKEQVQDQKNQIEKLKQIIRRLRLLLGENKGRNKNKLKSEGSVNQPARSLQPPPSELKVEKEKDVQDKRYPLKLQYGVNISESVSSYKWNHLSYSSKVKQIQVMMHSNGHVKALNFRYQLGEPPKPLSEGGRYAVFSCPDIEEYIKELRGGFYHGSLAYIKIRTNFNRQASFCMHELQNDEGHINDDFGQPLADEEHNKIIEEGQYELAEVEQKEQKAESEYKYEVKNEENILLTEYVYKEEVNEQDEVQKEKIRSLPKGTNKKKLPPLQKNCLKFEFGQGTNQYIMGFFGQSTNQGIVRLGCMVGLQKKPNFK